MQKSLLAATISVAALRDGVGDRPVAIEPGVIEFLNGKTVLGWAEVTLRL